MVQCELCDSEASTIRCAACASSGVGASFCNGCSDQLHSTGQRTAALLCNNRGNCSATARRAQSTSPHHLCPPALLPLASAAKGKSHALTDMEGKALAGAGGPAPIAVPAVKVTPASPQLTNSPPAGQLCMLCDDERATLHCANCDEDYCQTCCDSLHKPAKMASHVITKLAAEPILRGLTPTPPPGGHRRANSGAMPLASLSVGHVRSMSTISPANLLRSPMIGSQPAPATPGLGPRTLPITAGTKAAAPRLSLAMFPRTTPPPSAGSPPTGGSFNLLRQLSPPMVGGAGRTSSLLLSSANLLKPAPSPALTSAPAPTATEKLCGVCELDPATQQCDECNDVYCDGCDEMCHTPASKISHKRRPVGSAAPVAATPMSPVVNLLQPNLLGSPLLAAAPVPALSSPLPPLTPSPPVALSILSSLRPPPSDNEPSSGSLRALRRTSSLSSPELPESAFLSPIDTKLHSVIEVSPQPSPIGKSGGKPDLILVPPSPPSKEWEEENLRLAQLKTQQQRPVVATIVAPVVPIVSAVFATPLKKDLPTPPPASSPIPPVAATTPVAPVSLPAPIARPLTSALSSLTVARVTSTSSGPSSAASATDRSSDLDLDLDLGLDDFNDSDFALLDDDLNDPDLALDPTPPVLPSPTAKSPTAKSAVTTTASKSPPTPIPARTPEIAETPVPPSAPKAAPIDLTQLRISASSTEGPSDDSRPNTSSQSSRQHGGSSDRFARRPSSGRSRSHSPAPSHYSHRSHGGSSSELMNQLMSALHTHGRTAMNPSTALLHIAQLATAAAIEHHESAPSSARGPHDDPFTSPRLMTHRPSQLTTPDSPLLRERDIVLIDHHSRSNSVTGGGPPSSRRAQRDARLRESAAAWDAQSQGLPHPPFQRSHSEDEEWLNRKLRDRAVMRHTPPPMAPTRATSSPLYGMPVPTAHFHSPSPPSMPSPYHPAALPSAFVLSPDQQRSLGSPPQTLPPPFRFPAFQTSQPATPGSPFAHVPRSPSAPAHHPPHAVHALAVAAATAAYHHVARQFRSPPPPPPAPLTSIIPSDHPILGGFTLVHSPSPPFAPHPAPLISHLYHRGHGSTI